MLKRMTHPSGDETCSSCVVAGDFIYLAHHAGGFDRDDIQHQMRAAFDSVQGTLASVGATMRDMVQIHLYLKNLEDFALAREVFHEYFEPGCFPARMTSATGFLHAQCLCMVDGVAYRPDCAE